MINFQETSVYYTLSYYFSNIKSTPCIPPPLSVTIKRLSVYLRTNVRGTLP